MFFVTRSLPYPAGLVHLFSAATINELLELLLSHSRKVVSESLQVTMASGGVRALFWCCSVSREGGLVPGDPPQPPARGEPGAVRPRVLNAAPPGR